MRGLPASLAPPVQLALARPAEAIPPTAALPGGCLYEPKWDGFRAGVFTGDDGAALWSRAGHDLTGRFPDVVAAAAEQVPPGYVLDGEVVVWSDGRLDFAALQSRMSAGRRTLPRMARTAPASLAVFDLLAVAGNDIRFLPLRLRRELLVALAGDWEPPLNLSPATQDRDEAAVWFNDLAAAGIEGLVVKGSGQTYRGGERQWLKVRHRHPVDVVCAAVLGSLQRPSALVLGLPSGGRLRIVGRTVNLKREASLLAGRILKPAARDHPWPSEISPRILDRFTDRSDPIRLARVEPVVAEVSADTAFENGSFRHPVRFLRLRPDQDPRKFQDGAR